MSDDLKTLRYRDADGQLMEGRDVELIECRNDVTDITEDGDICCRFKPGPFKYLTFRMPVDNLKIEQGGLDV